MIDYTSIRDDKALYYTREIQLLFACVILGLTGANASDWHNSGCNTPAKLAFNIACAALTLPSLIYLLLATGPRKALRKLPWLIYGQVAIDALLFVLWLAATAASNYDCSSLCSACSPLEEGGGYYAWAGTLLCGCYYGQVIAQGQAKRALEGRAVSSASASAAKTMERSEKIAAKQGLDAVMIFLFLTTLCVTIWRIYQARKAHNDPSAHGPATEVPNQIEGLKEDSSAQKPAGATKEPSVSEVQ